MLTMENLSDADFKRTMLSALRLLAIITVVAAPIVWWKMGWASALLLLIGALISGSGLYEWLRPHDGRHGPYGAAAPSVPGLFLHGAGYWVAFFLRLGLTVLCCFMLALSY